MSGFDDFRAYLKPKGANPEINSAYYELASMEMIHGMWNCEILSLGFKPKLFSKHLIFRPIDPSKPIVFAVDASSSDGCCFVAVDGHLSQEKPEGMLNFDTFKTDKYIISCDDGKSSGHGKDIPHDFWSVKTEGETYVYGWEFPDTWQLSSVDLLCAFVGGGMTANQLRAAAYREQREEAKEERRQKHIEFLSRQLVRSGSRGETAARLAEHALGRLTRLNADLLKLTQPRFPLMWRSQITQLLDQ